MKNLHLDVNPIYGRLSADMQSGKISRRRFNQSVSELESQFARDLMDAYFTEAKLNSDVREKVAATTWNAAKLQSGHAGYASVEASYRDLAAFAMLVLGDAGLL